MRLEILRSTAICFFGNDHLLSSNDDRLLEVHFKSCFKGIESLEFVRPQAHKCAAPGRSFSTGSKAWFRRLKTDGIEQLRLYLPLSVFEPFPAEYGVIVDGPFGSEIYVHAPQVKAQHCEFASKRVTMWSLPNIEPLAQAKAAHTEALSALYRVLEPQGSSFGQIMGGLVKADAQGSIMAMGYEDLIPSSFSRRLQASTASAFRTAVTLTVPGLALAKFNFVHREIDAVWRTSMRLLESACAEMASGQMIVAA